MNRGSFLPLAYLALAACGSGAREAAKSAETAANADAATIEAVRDTDAATDAMKAADAELDNLGNSIDDDSKTESASKDAQITRY